MSLSLLVWCHIGDKAIEDNKVNGLEFGWVVKDWGQ
jgi:hypothetical protein